MTWGPRKRHNGYQVLALDGGLFTKPSKVNLKDNQSPSLQNVELDDVGAVGTCRGYTTFASIGSGPVVMLHEHYLGSSRKLVGACSGTVYYASSNTMVTVGSSQDIYSGTTDMKALTVMSYVVYTDGTTKLYRHEWDNTFVQLGVSANTTGGVSVVCQGAGPLLGDYHYWMTGINTNNVEGDYAEITSAAFTAASGRFELTDIPVFPASAGVSVKNLYRNTGAATAVPLLLTQITNGITGFLDDVDDSLLVTEAPTDNGVAPKCKYLVYYRGRLFGAGTSGNPSRLYYSNQGDPEIWPSANYVDVNAGDGYPITGLEVMGNSIVIHKNDGRSPGSIWLLYMPDTSGATDDTNWSIVKSPAAFSGQSDKAQAFFSNLLLFLNKSGAFAFNSQDLALSPAYSQVGTFGADAHSDAIEPDMQLMPDSFIHKATAITYDNKVWIAIPYGSATENNRIYVYDFVQASSPDRRYGAWTYRDSPGVNVMATYDGDLYGGSSTDGTIYQLDTGRNEDGAAIDSYFWTAPIAGDPQHRENTKVWRNIRLLVDTVGDWNMYVTYRVDFADEDGTTVQVNLNPGGGLWGAMVWGVDSWGGGTTEKWVTIRLANPVGTFLQLKFGTNTVDQYWKVRQMKLEYNLRSVR